MQPNFDILQNGDYEVRLVRNLTLDKQRNAQRKSYSLLFHFIYALLFAIALFFAMSASPAFLVIAPAVGVFTLLYSPDIVKLFSLVLPPVAKVCFEIGSGSRLVNILSPLFSYILCVLICCLISVCIIKGYTKNTVFAVCAVAYALVTFAQIAFLFIMQSGAFSLSALAKYVDELFKESSLIAIKSIDEQMTLESLKTLFGYTGEVTKAKIISDLTESFNAVFSAIKMVLPAIFVVSCMVYSFITVWVFSAFAKYFKMNTFVCIMDENWTFRPSIVSVRVYDIVFFVFIITMFINIPQNITAAILNLFIILTPMMFLMGLRAIFTLISKKVKGKTGAGVLTGIIVLLAMSIIGVMSVFIIGSIGTGFVIMREHAEKLIVPIKLLEENRQAPKE